jgi:uncharacterized membrane protein
MNIKSKVIILFLLSMIINVLWISGLITANISLFFLAMIMLIPSLIIAKANFNELKEFFRKRNGKVIEDEREEYIKEQAGYMAYGLSSALNIYIAVALLTLRNVYPQYSIVAYALLLVTVIGLGIYIIGTYYYKNKY